MAETVELPRHAIVTIDPRTLQAGEASCLSEQQAGALVEWIEMGRPAVVSRRSAGTPPWRVSLGVAFPPSSGRPRTALSVDRRAIRSIGPPPALEAVISCAPASWREGLAELAAQGQSRGLRFRVFGSLAWQALTSMRYVTELSDVDLLLYPRTEAELEAGVSLLRTWQECGHLRADGEIVLPDGRAVAWREWDAGASQVLTKSPVGVALASRRDVRRAFAA